ncbi:hypothetical protein ACVBEJ_10875 [Porticoccus sp. GXU_MW_L64]
MTPIVKGNVFTLFLCCLAVAVVLLFVTPPASSPVSRAVLNSGHIALFAVFSFFCYPKLIALTQRYFSFLKLPVVRVLFFSVLAFCFGAGIEFIQAKVGRNSSWADVALNMLGVASGLCALGVFKYGKTARGFFCVAVVLAACVVACHKPYKWAKALYQRDASFPVLVDFSSAEVNKFVQGNYGASVRVIEMAPSSGAFHSRKMLEVSFSNTDVWPGWKLIYPYPDWSGYSQLYFRVFSKENGPVNIVLRINDELHNNHYNDRFNRSLTVNPGFNEFSIALKDIKNAPEHRLMNISRVGQLVWFAVRPENNFKLYFDSVVLNK